MDKKRLEEIKKMSAKARKSLEEELKTIKEDQERLRKTQLVLKALNELLDESADFRNLFERKLAELSLKEEAAIQDKS